MSLLSEISVFSSFVNRAHHHAFSDPQTLTQVHDIQKVVLSKKDQALIDFAKKFDGASLKKLQVNPEEVQFAYTQVSSAFLTAIKKVIQNVQTYHAYQLPQSWLKEISPGVTYGMQYRPIQKAGLYVPGGQASYPSTVVMNSIPAILAGVSDLVMTTPPQKNGNILPEILVTADLCGVHHIIKAGGAQAIFALAYGTESVPKVDKIVGPGNKYVAAAKQSVYGLVDIDKPAGPSEVLIYVDCMDYAASAAAELLAQIEHDPDNIGICLVNTPDLLKAVQKEVDLQFKTCSRQSILSQSLKNSGIYLTSCEEETLTCINETASEHLMLLTKRSDHFLPHIKHAGAIFCGPYTSVTLGDYFAGPNHVLPTGGAARFSSPLSVLDFMKFSSVLQYNDTALKKAAPHIKALTEIENLDAHYLAIKKRFLS